MAFEEKYKLIKETIQKYPDQLKQSWEEARGVHLPSEFKNIQNVVFCGMGGSALGARIIDSFGFDQLSVPLEVFNEHHLPSYISENTLVVISSYSGKTEETLSDLHDRILRKRAKVFGITTGGPLAEELAEKQIPSYIFDPKHNPSLQPRMSIGYACGTLLALLTSLGVLNIKDDEVYKTVNAMREMVKHYGDDTNLENKSASLAATLKDKIPVLVASEHLVGVAHTVKNQFNESAKTFATLFDLPELNHHLMEGLAHPPQNRDLLHFVFINSHLYDSHVQKHYPLTQEVVGKNGIGHSMYAPVGTSKLAQVFETLIFGSFVVYYLTKQYGIDPMEIPWVDYFKKQLKN